jgi:hypothetical protein
VQERCIFGIRTAQGHIRIYERWDDLRERLGSNTQPVASVGVKGALRLLVDRRIEGPNAERQQAKARAGEEVVYADAY